VLPGPLEYLSFLMAAPDISDEELDRLGIEIVERFGSEARGLLIPGQRLAAYRALVGEKIRSGFWNEMVGRDEMFFLFKLSDGTLKELRYSAKTRDEIARLCSELNNDPIERTSDMPRYLAGNPFYRDVAVRFHRGVPSDQCVPPRYESGG
jgi:hypothetical protein